MNTELTYEQKAILQSTILNPCTDLQTMPTASGKAYKIKPYTQSAFDPGTQIQLGSHVFNSAQLGDLLTILLDQYPELKI